MKLSPLSTLLAFSGLTAAQSLSTALQEYPDTSTFASFLPDLADVLANRTADQKYTLLVPTNAAFTSAHWDLSAQERRDYLHYHVLVSSLTSANFSAPAGLTVPTLLRSEQYNNRSGGVQLRETFGRQAGGQVLFIRKNIDSAATRKFRVRQIAQGDEAQVRSGLSGNATVTAVDGEWEGGSFQLIDTVLIPPMPCSDTIRAKLELSALDNALNRSGLWPTLNHTPNVTCLAPISSAFKAAGDPDQKLNQSDLINALSFHTLPMPVYSNYLTDGMEIKSVANLTVRIAVNASGTWFNDAKVLQQNVLTNNGLIHVLDKVMSPINNEKPATNSSTNSSTSKPNTASGLTASYQHYVAALIGVAALIVMQ